MEIIGQPTIVEMVHFISFNVILTTVKQMLKMDSNWHDIMDELLYSIERNTSKVLRDIERSFNHNFSFSEKFRNHFLPIVNNR